MIPLGRASSHLVVDPLVKRQLLQVINPSLAIFNKPEPWNNPLETLSKLATLDVDNRTGKALTAEDDIINERSGVYFMFAYNPNGSKASGSGYNCSIFVGGTSQS